MKTHYRDQGTGIGFSPWDDKGNAYVTWIVKGNGQALDPKMFDRAMERAGAVEMYVRDYTINPNYMRVRFTAYDKDGHNVTELVTEATRIEIEKLEKAA